MFMKKLPLEYQKVIKVYIPTYLWDSSDNSDSCDSCDSNDSSDSSDSSDNHWITEIVMKLKSSKCDKTQKLKSW